MWIKLTRIVVVDCNELATDFSPALSVAAFTLVRASLSSWENTIVYVRVGCKQNEPSHLQMKYQLKGWNRNKICGVISTCTRVNSSWRSSNDIKNLQNKRAKKNTHTERTSRLKYALNKTQANISEKPVFRLSTSLSAIDAPCASQLLLHRSLPFAATGLQVSQL